MIEIESPATTSHSILNLGFRPFFLLAAIHAAGAMILWLWFYISAGVVIPAGLSAVSWHAHEMIYGYGMAVVSGFLLTAIRNWTGIQTVNGWPLAALAVTWLLARLILFVPQAGMLVWTALFDLSFNLFFLFATAVPLVRARQWKQVSVWSKLVFLFVGNVLFYAGVAGWLQDGVRLGLYSGLYVIVSLILLMGRRVIPFFIEKRTGTQAVNHKWVDLASLVLMLLFLVVEVYWPLPGVATITALLLFALHLFRLLGWYAPGIWREPMLWVLYVGYAWLVFAFLLRGLQLFMPLNPMLALHAFAAGGVGMITIGMMARVSLGHTGRDVYVYPFTITAAFFLIGLAAVFRVLMPMIFPAMATYLVVAAQTLWISGFVLFVLVYFPILTKPRVDGRYG